MNEATDKMGPGSEKDSGWVSCTWDAGLATSSDFHSVHRVFVKSLVLILIRHTRDGLMGRGIA